MRGYEWLTMLRLISVTKIEELKIVQFFLKLTKKVTTAVFTLNVKFLKYPKSHQVLWLLLKDKFSPRTFKTAQSYLHCI